MFLLKLPDQVRLMDCNEILFVGQSEEDCMKVCDILAWLAATKEPLQVMKRCGKLDSDGVYRSFEKIFRDAGLTDSRLEKLFQDIKSSGLSPRPEFWKNLPSELR